MCLVCVCVSMANYIYHNYVCTYMYYMHDFVYIMCMYVCVCMCMYMYMHVFASVTSMFTCIAHVMEEDRGPERGIEFLTSSREHWQDSVLAIHLYWHLSLYYLGRLAACMYSLVHNNCVASLCVTRVRVVLQR